MNKLLETTIERAQKTIEQSKDWNKTYEEQAKILTEKKSLLDQFYKEVKQFEGIQFYITEAHPTQDNIFTVQARYQGQHIATIKIAEDKTTVTTTTYDESNKKIYNCDIQLNDEELNTKETYKFLEFFNKEIRPKGKLNEQLHTQALLLEEFSKTSSGTKLLTGIQPIKYSNLFYPIPIILNPKEEHGYIDILTRTKIRKLTIIEPLREDQTPEMVLANATSKAIFLLNLLHTEQGQQWYKILRISRTSNTPPNYKSMYISSKAIKGKMQRVWTLWIKSRNRQYWISLYDLWHRRRKDNIYQYYP